mmetsp:Transcript_108035/g.344996  ORF Transcript_108035/g.344996 Transcript_108035/m.344996 type:complete len:208 (-) Transcript_108035:26-649(-)
MRLSLFSIVAMSLTTVIQSGRRSSLPRKSRRVAATSLRYQPAVRLQKSVDSAGVACNKMWMVCRTCAATRPCTSRRMPRRSPSKALRRSRRRLSTKGCAKASPKPALWCCPYAHAMLSPMRWISCTASSTACSSCTGARGPAPEAPTRPSARRSSRAHSASSSRTLLCIALCRRRRRRRRATALRAARCTLSAACCELRAARCEQRR